MEKKEVVVKVFARIVGVIESRGKRTKYCSMASFTGEEAIAPKTKVILWAACNALMDKGYLALVTNGQRKYFRITELGWTAWDEYNNKMKDIRDCEERGVA